MAKERHKSDRLGEPVTESVQFDLLGDLRVDFVESGLVHIREGWASLRSRFRALGRKIITNQLLRYEDIRWVGTFRMRKRWLLAIAILFAPISVFWIITGLERPINMWFGLGSLLLCVLLPLELWARGTLCLGIASNFEIIVIPTQRRGSKVRRILGLLRQSHASPVWQLDGTKFDDENVWDNRPATGRGFNHWRRVIIGAALVLLGAGNLIRTQYAQSGLSMAMGLLAVALFVIWATMAVRSWVIDHKQIDGKR